MSLKSKNAVRGLLIALLAVLFISCGKSENDVKIENQKENKPVTDSTKLVTDSTKLVTDGKYFCTMHPLQQSNTPGAKCPICKMNMIAKTDYYNEMMDEHEVLEDKYQGKKNAIHFEVKLPVIKSEDCKEIIESALTKDEGIMGYSIDILDGVIHMYINKAITSKSKVEKLIADSGFDANKTKANPDAVANLPKDCR